MAALDGTIFQGRLLHILPARPARAAQPVSKAVQCVDSLSGDTGKRHATYQSAKRAALKASAADSTSWNSLFMRPEAVGDALTER